MLLLKITFLLLIAVIKGDKLFDVFFVIVLLELEKIRLYS